MAPLSTWMTGNDVIVTPLRSQITSVRPYGTSVAVAPAPDARIFPAMPTKSHASAAWMCSTNAAIPRDGLFDEPPHTSTGSSRPAFTQLPVSVR